mgnify:CR=1 FL=1
MYRDDDRGQSIQIGAVLLFGALIVALAGYQAFVVPQQNERVEFAHSQTVQDDMQDLRNALVSATGEASTRSVSVRLGTRYPDRIFAVNPGPAAGSLRTAGTTDSSVAIRIANARADGETGDFWTGASRTYSTGFVTYRPNYNRYSNAPTTVYEHSALVNDFDRGALALADPAFVEGRTVTLVALNGSLDATRVGAASVDVRPVSASTRTVSVTNTSGSRVTFELPTRYSESFWDEALADQQAPDGYVEDVSVTPGTPYNTLVVELTPGENYTLRLARAGLGTGVEGTDASYLTEVSGNGSGVPEEGSQQLVVEVRDAFNNPVSGVTVTGSAAGGSLVDRTASTDESGRATFQYEAPTVSEETPVALNFSYTVDPATTPTFDGEAVENVELTVYVQNTQTSGSGSGSGGASYALDWESPTVSEGGTYLTDCDDDYCTWDVGKDSDDTLDLTAGTGPDVEGLTLDFASNNSTVGTLSPSTVSTGSNGEGSTTLTALDNGTVKLYVFGSGGASDAINLTVANVTVGEPTADFTYSPSSPETGERVQFTDQSSDDGSISSYAWDFDGDGTVESTAENPTYTYSSSGTYTVELTVTDDEGNTDTATDTVTVSSSDTTAPTFDRAEAQSRSSDGDNKDVERVDFTADVSDDTAVDRVEVKVFDKNGNLRGSRTFQSEPFYSEGVTLDPDIKTNGGGNYLTVELTAHDTSGNSLTCTGRIDTSSERITASGGGLSCSQTSTGAVPPVGPGSGPGGSGGAGGAALVVAVLGVVLALARRREIGRRPGVVA